MNPILPPSLAPFLPTHLEHEGRRDGQAVSEGEEAVAAQREDSRRLDTEGEVGKKESRSVTVKGSIYIV